MAQCGACGAERQAGTRFCRRCGREFGFEAPGPQIDTSSVPESAPVQAPPQHSSSAPPPDAIGHGPGWYAVLAGVVAVLIVAAVLGGIALTTADPDVDPAAVPTTTTQAQPGSPTTPASPRGPTRPAPTTSDEPAPNLGNDVVTVSPVPAKHSLAPLVVEIVTSYFVSINTRDFDTYRSLFTTDLQAALDPDQLAAGYRSTHDQDVVLADIEQRADGRAAAWVEFTSTQDAADGIDGQTCTDWRIALFLQTEGGRAAIGAPPEDYRAGHQAC